MEVGGTEIGMVCTGLDEGYSGMGKEGYMLLMSERTWKCIIEYGWKGARMVCMKCENELMKFAFISLYAIKNMKSVEGNNERVLEPCL